jgi:hypothetical protein
MYRLAFTCTLTFCSIYQTQLLACEPKTLTIYKLRSGELRVCREGDQISVFLSGEINYGDESKVSGAVAKLNQLRENRAISRFKIIINPAESIWTIC